MMNQLKKRFKKKYNQKIDPDEIFMDSSNLPGFDTYQFEGRMEKSISTSTFSFLGTFFLLIFLIFLARLWKIQIADGEQYLSRSVNNKLRNTLIFSDRGIIYDRNENPLAWNEHREEEFNSRKYLENYGLSNILGYVSYPKKDSAGFYYDKSIDGIDGIEKFYNDILQGQNGLRIIETDSVNKIISENTVRPPENGENIYLTIDADLQKKMYESVKKIVYEAGFSGGGAVIMDIYTGEILTMVSYPEYDSNILTEGTDREKISSYTNDKRNPFLNKVIRGLYTPGSIVKPYIALAAMQEKVISPTDKIVSRGTLVIPNPYNPDNPSIFTDWKAHGPVDVKQALAYSSNIYFYVVGGGFEDIKGLGITKIENYIRKFGFGSEIKTDIFKGLAGTIPNPEWKKKNFNNDDWRLGDTYFTSIGQYGFQVTPLQVVRAVGAVANKGMLIEPNLILDSNRAPQIQNITGIDDWVWQTIHEGMRGAVTYGTSKGLAYDDLQIATKSGTAELGVTKEKVNSWLTGFWPYENPRYAFAVFLEQGARSNLIGGVAVSRDFFDWMKVNKPEYLK